MFSTSVGFISHFHEATSPEERFGKRRSTGGSFCHIRSKPIRFLHCWLCQMVTSWCTSPTLWRTTVSPGGKLLPKPISNREKPLMLFFFSLLLMSKCCPFSHKTAPTAASGAEFSASKEQQRVCCMCGGCSFQRTQPFF